MFLLRELRQVLGNKNMPADQHLLAMEYIADTYFSYSRFYESAQVYRRMESIARKYLQNRLLGSEKRRSFEQRIQEYMFKRSRCYLINYDREEIQKDEEIGFKIMKKLLAEFPQDSYADRCRLVIGDRFRRKDQFSKAINLFEKIGFGKYFRKATLRISVTNYIWGKEYKSNGNPKKAKIKFRKARKYLIRFYWLQEKEIWRKTGDRPRRHISFFNKLMNAGIGDSLGNLAILHLFDIEQFSGEREKEIYRSMQTSLKKKLKERNVISEFLDKVEANPSKSTKKKVKQNIRKIGSKQYARRKKATRTLRNMGPKIGPLLKEALNSDRAEIRHRIRSVLFLLALQHERKRIFKQVRERVENKEWRPNSE